MVDVSAEVIPANLTSKRPLDTHRARFFYNAIVRPLTVIAGPNGSGKTSVLFAIVQALRGWLDGKLSRELLDQVGGIWMFPQDRNLGNRVIGTKISRSLIGPAQDQEDWGTSIYEAGADLKPVWGILERMSSEARARRDEPGSAERSLEAQLQDLFHRICAPKEHLGFRYPGGGPVGAPYFRDGASVYPLNLAASGEQVIIEYITRLLYPTPMNYSLVLIDEPEAHLHPGWIRKLYHDLPHIGMGNQFIVTTHFQELRALAAEDGCLVQLGGLEG